MEKVDRKAKFYIGYLLCVCGFGLTFWAFFPGMMSPDSFANLTDGRNHYFNDLHSPLMSFLWGEFNQLAPGPVLMFLLQNILFWAGCAIFWRSVKRQSFGLGIYLCLFGLMPHILSQLTTVWKDVGMGTALFLTVALLYYAKKSKSRFALLISPLFLFYGYAVRLNALPAVLPIAVWSGFVATQIFEIRKPRLFAALSGLFYFFLLSGAVYFTTYTLTQGRTNYPFQQIYLYDLAAISAARNEAVFPEYILRDRYFSLEGVQTRYNVRSVNDLIYPDIPSQNDLPILKLSGNPEEILVLRQKWLTAISENPFSYLRHRTKVFATLIGLNRSVTRAYWDIGFASSPPEFRGNENVGNKILMKYFGVFRRPFSQTFFFRGIVWLLLSVFFLYQAIRRKLRGDWDLVFILSSSCLLFTFAYFPTTPSTEFRYLFWSAISSALATGWGIYLWRKEKSEVFNQKI